MFYYLKNGFWRKSKKLIRKAISFSALLSIRTFGRFLDTTNQTVEEAKLCLHNTYVPKKEYAKKKASGISCKQPQIFLSIIIPVFNGERYLRECIESVLLQEVDFRYELICVNDGSTDSSLSILREYADDSQMKIITQENGGISAARNRGLNEAKGQYVLFIDNDDILDSSFLQRMGQRARCDRADIIKCGYQIIQEGQLGRKCIEYESNTFTGDEIDRIYQCNGYCWGMLIRRSLFDNISFPDGYWYEDMVTRLLLYPQCSVFSYIGEALYYYRVHSSNASGTVWNRRNNKALDQYYLPKQIIETALMLNLPFGRELCCAYQYEIGVLLFNRTLNLEKEVREAAFVLACTLNDELIAQCPDYINCGSLSERIINKAFMARDFRQWERICKYSTYLY